MQDKIELLKLAAEDKTKAYDKCYGDLESARNRLSGHRKQMSALGLELASQDATKRLDALTKQLTAAEVELQRHNSGMNQRAVRALQDAVANERQRVEVEGARAELVSAKQKEADLIAKEERLAAEVKLAEAEKRDADALLAYVTEWMSNAGELEHVPVTIPKDATLESVRSTIEEFQAELVEVDTARLDNATLKKQARAIAAQMAEDARPSLSGLGDELRIESTADALSLAAWLHTDALVKKLEACVDSLPGDGLSAKERQSKRLKLEADILELSRVEEALITRDGGIRRPDANPMAVLQVKPKEPAKAA